MDFERGSWLAIVYSLKADEARLLVSEPTALPSSIEDTVSRMLEAVVVSVSR